MSISFIVASGDTNVALRLDQCAPAGEKLDEDEGKAGEDGTGVQGGGEAAREVEGKRIEILESAGCRWMVLHRATQGENS